MSHELKNLLIHLQISNNRALGLLYVKIKLGIILNNLFNFPVLLIIVVT